MPITTIRAVALTLVLLAAGAVSSVRSQAPAQAPVIDGVLQSFTYRNTGPFRMQARIAAIAVPTTPARDHL